MRNTFFVQVVLPLATAGFCALYWIFLPPDLPPTAQTLFANKPCPATRSWYFNTGTVKDSLPLLQLVTPEQLDHLRYLLSRPDARRLPKVPRIEESQASESLDDQISNGLSSTTIGNLSAPSTYVNEQVMESLAASLAVGVADQASASSLSDSNNSSIFVQQSLADTSTLPACVIHFTNSSIAMVEKTAIFPATVGEYLEDLSPVNNTPAYQVSSNSSGASDALFPIGVEYHPLVHSDRISDSTNQSMDALYSDLISVPDSQPIDMSPVTSNAESLDTVNITFASATSTRFILSPLAEIVSDSNSTSITITFSPLVTRGFAALVSFFNAQSFYCACAIFSLIVLSFLLLLNILVVPSHRREDPTSTSVLNPMSTVIVVRRPLDAPPPPGPRRLQRRFSEPNISYSYATSRAHCIVSGAYVTERVESTSTVSDPTVEPHIEQSRITPSSSSSTTSQTSATESTAVTSDAESPSPVAPPLKPTLSANGPRHSLTCLPSGSLPTPKADFYTSPSQSFDAYYAAQASEEEWVQPSSSKFMRHGRNSEALRRRHTTGRLGKENCRTQEQDHARTGGLVQSKVYRDFSEIHEEAVRYGGRLQTSRRRHTTGRARKEHCGTEEPGYARTAVLVQNRVYDINDEGEGAFDDSLDDPSPVTLSASGPVQPSATASEESSSQVGLGISIGTGRRAY